MKPNVFPWVNEDEKYYIRIKMSNNLEPGQAQHLEPGQARHWAGLPFLKGSQQTVKVVKLLFKCKYDRRIVKNGYIIIASWIGMCSFTGSGNVWTNKQRFKKYE